MNWISLVFISAITSALTRIFQKTLLKDKDSDPFAFGFMYGTTIALIFLLYTITTNSFDIPDLSGLSINIIISALFYSLGSILIFKALKIAQASEISIIITSSTVWSVITSLFVLGEKLTLNKVAGIIFVLFGVIAINFSKTHLKINKGHLFAIIGAIFYGVAFVNDVFILKHFQSISSYNIISFSLPAIITLFCHPKSIRNISFYLTSKNLLNLLVCGIINALATLTIFEAYRRGGEASVISPISQTSVIFTVIFGYFILKEKDKLPNKILGALFAFIGVLFLI